MDFRPLSNSSMYGHTGTVRLAIIVHVAKWRRRARYTPEAAPRTPRHSANQIKKKNQHVGVYLLLSVFMHESIIDCDGVMLSYRICSFQ